MMTRNLAVVFACALISLTGAGADAGLIAYDSFGNTPVGAPLIGTSSTGSGFVDPWHPGGFNASIFANYTIAAGSLSDGGLATAGNSVSTTAQSAISGVTRDLTTPLGAAGTTDYFSILLRPDGPITGGTFNNYFGAYLNSSTGNDVFFGKPGNGPINDYDVESRGGTLQSDSGVAAVTGQTVLLVLRADFTAGNDTFTLYVNPTPGGTEPLSGAVKQDTDIGIVAGLTLYSTGAFTVDEVRVGTTYADVVPVVPEPSSLALVALGGLGIFAAAARSRRGGAQAA